jgi:hypothetical protein
MKIPEFKRKGNPNYFSGYGSQSDHMGQKRKLQLFHTWPRRFLYTQAMNTPTEVNIPQMLATRN